MPCSSSKAPRSEASAVHARAFKFLDREPVCLQLPCMATVRRKRKERKALLIGLGLDSDGHKRLTTGPNFVLAGGSGATHESLIETATTINEKLEAKGKRLEDISRE